MHKTNSILMDMEKQLSRSGLDYAYVQSSMQELREHWEDVKSECEAEGLSELEAEEIANSRLGDSAMLAKMFKERKQQASWVGRHPVIIFGFTPFVAIIMWWIAFLSLQALTSGVLAWENNKTMPEPPWEWMQRCMRLISISSGVILPVIFCRLSSRFYTGYSSALLGCLCIAAHNYFHWTKLTPPVSGRNGSFAWGYQVAPSMVHPSLTGLALPLLVFLIFVLSNQMRSRVLLQK